MKNILRENWSLYMFGYFVLTRENILLSSRFSALKICQIYCHCHTLLKLSIHSFRHPACEIVVAFRLSDDACLLGTCPCYCIVFMEGVWRRGISTPSVEVFQLSKQHSTELKELFNIFLLLTAFSHLLHVNSGLEWFSPECRQ